MGLLTNLSTSTLGQDGSYLLSLIEEATASHCIDGSSTSQFDWLTGTKWEGREKDSEHLTE